MNQEELDKILELHKRWLNDESDGKRAELINQDLRGSNLSYSNLRGSDLSGSNLSYSNLSYSNLSYSDLSYSNLRGSNLSEVVRLDPYTKVISISNIGTEFGEMICFVSPDSGIQYVIRGCFRGTLKEMKAEVKKRCAGTPHEKSYKQAFTLINTLVEAEVTE